MPGVTGPRLGGEELFHAGHDIVGQDRQARVEPRHESRVVPHHPVPGRVVGGSVGQDLAVLSAKKALRVQTKADGKYILEITDSAKTTFYVAAQLPAAGAADVSAILATGDYGT